jgi:peptide/nickel transport system substrate-binding protein
MGARRPHHRGKEPYYYRADEGLPYLDTVIYRFVTDSNAAVAQLIAGECDIIDQRPPGRSVRLLLKLEEQGVVKPTFVTGTTWEHVDFCINPIESYDRRTSLRTCGCARLCDVSRPPERGGHDPLRAFHRHQHLHSAEHPLYARA